jgi:hypothetical protein
MGLEAHLIVLFRFVGLLPKMDLRIYFCFDHTLIHIKSGIIDNYLRNWQSHTTFDN